MSMISTVYKTVLVTTKSRKIYHQVTATRRGSDLLHADKHTAVLIIKIEELNLYIQKI